VFENATVFPMPEKHITECPPPTSAYGFQKLACEYFAYGAYEQYALPYTIIRPFNCVGTGEQRAVGGREIPSGNVKLAISHMVPDLIQKVAKGQDPLHILGDGAQESLRGFEVGLELTPKAYLLGYRVDEVSSSWTDRTGGTSKFDLVGWLPAYLHWYGLIMRGPLVRWTSGALAALAAARLLRRRRRGDLG
jgi:hypothetical protein